MLYIESNSIRTVKFLFILISIFVSTNSFSKEIKPLVYLESHLHVFFNEQANTESANKNINAYIKQGTFSKAFVISPAYTVGYTKQINIDLSYREIFDQKTAELVQKHPNHLIGICGLYEYWNDGADVLNECLEYKGMIGVKIRLVSHENKHRLSDPVAFDNIVRALEVNQEKIKVVLIHTQGDYAYTSNHKSVHSESEVQQTLVEEVNDLKKLIELGARFPDIQFVVAHSLYSPKLVEVLSDLKQKNNLKNFWIEISTALDVLVTNFMEDDKNKKWEQYAKVWRKFGINKILFGSDSVLAQGGFYIWENQDLIPREYNNIANNKYLSKREKNLILNENGKQLIKKITKKRQ